MDCFIAGGLVLLIYYFNLNAYGFIFIASHLQQLSREAADRLPPQKNI